MRPVLRASYIGGSCSRFETSFWSGAQTVRRYVSPGASVDATDRYSSVNPLHLDLPLTVSPAIVSPTRRLLESKLAPVLDDEDAVFRVAMTAHELLENAAKYASDGKA